MFGEIDVSSYVGKSVVTSAHKALFRAITDLTQLGMTLNIELQSGGVNSYFT